MIRRKLFYTLIALTLVMGTMLLYDQLFNHEEAAVPVNIREISTDTLAVLMENDNPDAVYIDVREQVEFAAGHIEGMINMPLSGFEQSYTSLPKDQEIVIICRSGSRSMQAAEILQKNGYLHIVNVNGGMLAWKGKVVEQQ